MRKSDGSLLVPRKRGRVLSRLGSPDEPGGEERRRPRYRRQTAPYTEQEERDDRATRRRQPRYRISALHRPGGAAQEPGVQQRGGSGPARTVHVGGQNAVDASGNIVGKGDVAAQTEQVLANVRAALAAGGAEPEHVVKWNLFVVEGVSLQEGYSAFQRAWVDTPNPPAITAAFVAGLANPEYLVEMDAIAVVPL